MFDHRQRTGRSRERRRHCAAAIGIVLVAANPAAADTAVVARAGDQAPGLAAGVLYGLFNIPLLNANGQAAYRSTLTGAGVTFANESSLWRDAALVARAGDAAPGLGAGVNYGSLSIAAFNAAGQMIYGANLSGNVTTGNDFALFRDTTLLAREGSQVAGQAAGTNYSLWVGTAALNDNGQVAHTWFLDGPAVSASNNFALLKDGAIVAREGDPAPGLAAGTNFGSFGNPVLNNAGQLAYQATFAFGGPVTTQNDSSLWRDSTLIAREDGQAPGLAAGLLYGSLLAPVMNASGQVAYYSGLRQGGLSAGEAIWRDSTLIARMDTQAPGLAVGINYGFLGADYAINDAGQVAYTSSLTGAPVHGGNNSALWLNNLLIAREGNAAGGVLGALGIAYGQITGAPAMSAGGRIVFGSALTGSGVGAQNNEAIWLADDEQSVLVARTGDALAGGLVGTLGYGRGAVNDAGQVAFRAGLTNGSEVVALYTPELHWRRSFSSAWDTTDHWTVGIAPGDVHDVFIDPATSLTVYGPTTARTVKSLEIGGGSGLATLYLGTGALTATNGTVIRSTGILSGDGVMHGALTNHGTIRVSNLTLSSALVNHGVVTGSGRVAADLDNRGDGELRVGLYESFHLVGSGHGNAGRIEITNGELEIDGKFFNDAGATIAVHEGTARFNHVVANENGGRVFVDDAIMFFDGGLSNSGLFTATFGETSLFGSILNEKFGRLILSGNSNTTFYDDVVIGGGSELRVSAGSTAVFFGAVSGTGAFTGTGTKFYEGSFAPGASPGWVIDQGNVNFGVGHRLEMELAGLTPGLEHDRLSVDGTLGLDGTLALILLDGYQPRAGDRFDLLDWGTLIGTFVDIDLGGALLGDGLSWDFSNLYLDGSVTVASTVPLPPAMWLFAGAAGLLLRRRAARTRG
ncbi:MAG: choice-of-anchor tandem repeat NxxGxxAF-containing protein [Gammaproteobacteria bacterium]